jgi:aminomethyltransferase
LSVLLTEKGGIIDDLMITRISPTEFYIVTNAARRKEDIAHFKTHLAKDIQHTLLDDNGLLALQGPSAATVLQNLTTHKLEQLKFGSSAYATVIGIPDVLVSRGGYTGEDGFEISVPGADGTRNVASAILDAEEVKWAGLGARDSLRLEAGLCLYGHDLSEEISPVEAGLSWLVGKQRTGYLGEEHIKAQQADLKGIKRRVGFVVEGAPARGALSLPPETWVCLRWG